jgi:hypothetical protein
MSVESKKLKNRGKRIEGECNIFYPKKLFKIIDVINNKNYLFIGSYPEVDNIINKINKTGIDSINSDDERKLKTKYNFVNLNKSIDSNTILVKDFINDDDTILTIKKKNYGLYKSSFYTY